MSKCSDFSCLLPAVEAMTKHRQMLLFLSVRQVRRKAPTIFYRCWASPGLLIMPIVDNAGLLRSCSVVIANMQFENSKVVINSAKNCFLF